MAAKKTTLKPVKRGQKPVSFTAGGLHQSLGVPAGQKIPAKQMAAAARGDYGPKAASQARFARNVLTGPKSGSKTAGRKSGGRSGGKGK